MRERLLRPVGASAGLSHLAIAKNAIKRDRIAGDAAHLLKPYLPPRDRKLRLPDIYEIFEQIKDQA